MLCITVTRERIYAGEIVYNNATTNHVKLQFPVGCEWTLEDENGTVIQPDYVDYDPLFKDITKDYEYILPDGKHKYIGRYGDMFIVFTLDNGRATIHQIRDKSS